MTIHDETGVANLVVWTKVFETHRRVVVDAGMIGFRGRMQREGEGVHLVVLSLADLSREFASVGRRGRADDCLGDGGRKSRNAPPRMSPPKVMADPYERVIAEIRVKTRDFQ